MNKVHKPGVLFHLLKSLLGVSLLFLLVTFGTMVYAGGDSSDDGDDGGGYSGSSGDYSASSYGEASAAANSYSGTGETNVGYGYDADFNGGWGFDTSYSGGDGGDGGGGGGGFTPPPPPPCTCNLSVSPATIESGDSPINLSYTRSGGCSGVSEQVDVFRNGNPIGTIAGQGVLTPFDSSVFPAGANTLSVSTAGLSSCSTVLTVNAPSPDLAVMCPANTPSPKNIGGSATIPATAGGGVQNVASVPSNAYQFRYEIVDTTTLGVVASYVTPDPPLNVSASQRYPFVHSFTSPGSYRLRVRIEPSGAAAGTAYPDLNASNNVADCQPFTIQPGPPPVIPPPPSALDIAAVPVALTSPTALPGASIGLGSGFDIAENLSAVTSQPFTVTIYRVIDGVRDNVVGTRSVSPLGPMPARAQYTASLSVTAPSTVGSTVCLETVLNHTPPDDDTSNDSVISSNCTTIVSPPPTGTLDYDLDAGMVLGPLGGLSARNIGDTLTWNQYIVAENVSTNPSNPGVSSLLQYSRDGGPRQTISVYTAAAPIAPSTQLRVHDVMPGSPAPGTVYDISGPITWTVPAAAQAGTYCFYNELNPDGVVDPLNPAYDINPSNNVGHGPCIYINGIAATPGPVDWAVRITGEAGNRVIGAGDVVITESQTVDYFYYVADPYWTTCSLYADGAVIDTRTMTAPNQTVSPSVQPDIGSSVDYTLQCSRGGAVSAPLNTRVVREANQPIVSLHYSTSTSVTFPIAIPDPVLRLINDGDAIDLLPDPQDSPLTVQIDSMSTNIIGQSCTVVSGAAVLDAQTRNSAGVLSFALTVAKPVPGGTRPVTVSCQNLSPDTTPTTVDFTIGGNPPANLEPRISAPSGKAALMAVATGDPLTGTWSSLPISYRIENNGGSDAPAGVTKTFEVILERITTPAIGSWNNPTAVVTDTTSFSGVIPAAGDSSTQVEPVNNIPWGEYTIEAITNLPPSLSFTESNYLDNYLPPTTIVVPTPAPNITFRFLQNGADREQVRYDTEINLEVDIVAAFPLSCVLRGPTIPTTGSAVNHAGSVTAPTATYSFNIPGLTSRSTYSLTCLDPMNDPYDFEGAIDVIPLVEES